jgi:hypothetical protein
VDRLEGAVWLGAYGVSGEVGDFDGSYGRGLYYGDSRHLSGLRLLIGGVLPVSLGAWRRGSRPGFPWLLCGCCGLKSRCLKANGQVWCVSLTERLLSGR